MPMGFTLIGERKREEGFRFIIVIGLDRIPLTLGLNQISMRVEEYMSLMGEN